jgi:hypothetical protein
MISGVVSAFVANEGVVTAAVVTAGAVVVLIAYLGPYITHIKFQEFEADLQSIRRSAVHEVRTVEEEAVKTVRSVKDEAVETVRALQDVARSYESLRSNMPGGGQRDVEFDEALAAPIRPLPSRHLMQAHPVAGAQIRCSRWCSPPSITSLGAKR